MNEHDFVEMVQTGNYEKSLKKLTDKIVENNCTILYNIFRKYGLINDYPNLFKYIKKISNNKAIYRDILGLIQNVIVIKNLSNDEIIRFWRILTSYSRMGCSEIYNFTYGEMTLHNKTNFTINEANLLCELMKKLESINFTFYYRYDEHETMVGFEAYQIPIVIIMNCD